MDGVIVLDKPRGLTSHDVVAAARRALGEKHIGHTGTLDPLATGVLPLAVGRARRLVRFMTASDKDYYATIRFGVTTDSFDITGAETGGSRQMPSRDVIADAVRRLTGDYLQAPPAFSAKKVGGRRAYDLARREQPVTLPPVPVSVTRAELLDVAQPYAVVTLTCSAGFYVRSFAHALGELTGTGACLEALRRTRSGEFGLDAALSMEMLYDRGQAAAGLKPLAGILGRFPTVTVTASGRSRVAHGRELGPADLAAGTVTVQTSEWVRVLDDAGLLVAMATAGQAPGSLHPSVVLI